MINFRYWPRIPWPNISLDREHSSQISINLEQFLHFGMFLAQKQDFLPMCRATWRSLFLGAPKSQKLSVFGFDMTNYAFLPMDKKFG